MLLRDVTAARAGRLVAGGRCSSWRSGCGPGWLLGVTDPVVRRLLGRLPDARPRCSPIDWLARRRRRCCVAVARRSLLLVLDAVPAAGRARHVTGWLGGARPARRARACSRRCATTTAQTFCVPGQRPGAARPARTSSTTSRSSSRRWCWSAARRRRAALARHGAARRHPGGGVLLPAARARSPAPLTLARQPRPAHPGRRARGRVAAGLRAGRAAPVRRPRPARPR